MVAYAFDEDIASSPSDEPGVRRAQVSNRWTTGNGTPNGGYLLAIALRGLAAEVSCDEPLAVAVSFLRPGTTGEAVLRSRVVRSGRRVTTGECVLEQGGKPVLSLTAQLSQMASRSGHNREDGCPPALPAPQECRAAEHREEPGITISNQVDYRMPQEPPWSSGQLRDEATLEFWVRFADGRPIDLIALPFLADAYVPATMVTGARGAISVQLTAYLHRVPAAGWLACRATTRHVVDGYHEERMEMWDQQGRLVAQSMQLLMWV